MSRDIRAVVDGVIHRPEAGITIIVLAIPASEAHGIERETMATLNIKEPA